MILQRPLIGILLNWPIVQRFVRNFFAFVIYFQLCHEPIFQNLTNSTQSPFGGSHETERKEKETEKEGGEREIEIINMNQYKCETDRN